MYNDTFSNNNHAVYRAANPHPNHREQLPMMLDSHGNPVRISSSQIRKAVNGNATAKRGPFDFNTQPAPSHPTQHAPQQRQQYPQHVQQQQQQQQQQQRRASGIPQRVQGPSKVVRQAHYVQGPSEVVRQHEPPVRKVKEVNMTAPRSQPQIHLPSTPDTNTSSRHSTTSTVRTISVRRSPKTYWRGLPFLKNVVLGYAEAKGWDVRKPGTGTGMGPGRELDEEETWCAFKDNVFEETGIRVRVRELGRPLPILTFYSNREMDEVTRAQKVQIRRLLLDMGYDKDFPLVWYTDRNAAQAAAAEETRRLTLQ